MDLLKERTFLVSGISIIWYNTDGCEYHYRCATVLYLLLILLQAFNMNIGDGIIVPVHGREVVYGLNTT